MLPPEQDRKLCPRHGRLMVKMKKDAQNLPSFVFIFMYLFIYPFNVMSQNVAKLNELSFRAYQTDLGPHSLK
jgi:hypothetical protein